MSQTVKDLTAGSGITYVERGEYELKGVPTAGGCTRWGGDAQLVNTAESTNRPRWDAGRKHLWRGILGDSGNGDGRFTVDHAATIRRMYELITVGDIDGFGELLVDDFVEHEEALPGMEQNKDGVKQLFHVLRTAFPDLRMEPQDVLVSGDKAVARVSATGTHQGEFMGMPASGRSIDVQLIDIIRFGDDGLAREHWGIFDQMKMMQQLGAVPAPAGA